MSRKLKRLLLYMFIAILPLCMRFFCSVIMGENVKLVNLIIIAAVSGAITEIASVVVLGIHNKSALQLNYYYDALHENEKLLSAINMADKLNSDKREEMYIEIIRKQIDIQPKNKEDNK